VCKAFGLVVIALAVTSSFAADWPQFRGERNDGVVRLQKPVEKLAVATLWQVPSGDSFSAVTVAGGKVFTKEQRDTEEFLVVLDAASGKELHPAIHIDKTVKDNSGNGPRSTPVVEGSRVYIYSSYMKFICFDMDQGRILWNYDICKDYGGKVPLYGNATSPVLIGDLVLITGGGEGRGIMAFKKASGELAWAVCDEPHTHVTPVPATIARQEQVICYMKSGLVSVDPRDGKVLWTFAHPNPRNTAASPVVGGKDGNIVFASAAYGAGGAACKVTRDGDQWVATRLWGTKGKHQVHWSTPIYYDGYMYGLFGQANAKGTFECLDISTGEVKWSTTFDNRGGMVLMGDKLLVQEAAGDLVLVAASPEGYKELDRVAFLKGKNWTAPSFANGMIFARNNSEKDAKAQVVCLKLGGR